VQRGAIDQHEAGRGLEIHGGGELERAVRLHGHLLGETADAAQRDHAIAGREAGHALAHLAHDARDLAARGEGAGRLDLVFAAHHQPVGEVDAGGVYLHQQLARAGHGVGSVFQGQPLDGAEFVADDRLHAASPVGVRPVPGRWCSRPHHARGSRG
jgi:hypothetical protein